MDGDVKVLVEAIENAFEVRFGRDEIDDDSRIEDVCDALRIRFGDRTQHTCFSSIAFWRLRRAFVDVLQIPRSSIRPLVAVEYVIPEYRRRTTWRAVSGAAGLKLPGLEYPQHVGVAIVWASFIPSMLLPIIFRGGWWIAAAFIAMPVNATLLFNLLRPFAVAVPAHSRDFGDLAKTVAALNYGRLVQEFGSSREREFVEALRFVIADVTDIDPLALVEENPRLIDLVLANDGLRPQV